MFKYLALVSLLLISVAAQKKYWHSSQLGLRQLYDLQNEHFEVFHDYLDLETKRLEELKINLVAINEWRGQKITTENLHNHVSVLKRMTFLHRKLLKIDDLMDNKQSMEALSKIDEHKDLSGDHTHYIFQSLRRLQRFYGIPASDMAAGRYDDRTIGDPFDACECFVMAEWCMKEYDMYGVIDWAVEAYKKWKENGRPECIPTEMLHYFIVGSSAFTGFNFKNILSANELPYLNYIVNFEKHFTLMKNELVDMDKRRAIDVFDEYNRAKGIDVFSGFKFINLCKRGVSLRTITKDSKCRYQTKNSYYRLLMPFKEEDLSSDPLVKIYHDVLYEEEISIIKKKAVENMIETQVITKAGHKRIEYHRLGQVNWLDNVYCEKHLGPLNARIESFSGWTIQTAEYYQIVNYGLGGHYGPHHDYFSDKNHNKAYGNRLSTVLFYLNDVENDGYTVFPCLNIVCPVETGSALVWQNLHPSNGSGHWATLHGSCPLLNGNKWIMTKWIYEEGQFLSYKWKDKYPENEST